MNKKHLIKILDIFANAITLTLFTLVQMLIFMMVQSEFRGAGFVIIFVTSLVAVPLLSWALFKIER